MRPTVWKNISHTVKNAIKINFKKSDVNRAKYLLQKKTKTEESVTFQNIFSLIADFRHVVSVLPAARLLNPSRIFVAEKKS